ncbi:hypothetical protein [Corallococcus sicarius]|uniref:Uncharacterized protein n=1 Tax=Corallococcus sicarius TaxID=2316726 RepID=A0A3A8P921_9BACT|nr:hypothetical protein [Corallococcus sicarius]RKH48294.1 hypothetical protein D7X12_00635 [Corallococcus sicarius]
MHHTRHVPLALMLLLAAPGLGCGDEPAVVGSMRVRYGETWKDANVFHYAMFRSNADTHPDFDFFPVFTICNADTHVDEPWVGVTGLCVNVDFESFDRGNGPATFSIDGTVQVPPLGARGDINNNVDFEAGPGHSPGLKEAWVRTNCSADLEPEDLPRKMATQQVSGQFVLKENSKNKLKGHLALTVNGETGGNCPGDAAEVDLHFDLSR